LDWLVSLGTRDARLCGYYLSYDWTMILKDLPDGDIYRLLRPETRALPGGSFERIAYEGYLLHFLAGAMWIARDDERAVAVWDVGKFFQGPFVDALHAWDVAPDVRDRIAQMKARRSLFAWRERKRIRDYCLAECGALAELATLIERAHTDAGLKMRSWFGPGSTAGTLLARHNIREKRGIIPPPVEAAARIAYFGGRAEISTCGTIARPVYGYDISSAYPYHASMLPCLEHSRWERTALERDIEGAAHAVVCGDIESAHPAEDWAPLPIRQPGGTIVFPSRGARGYWWRDEWLAARRGWRGLRFDHAFLLRTDCGCRPFDFVPALFARRKEVGKETGEGKVLKLAINSVYGKLAQTVGPAQYASRVWAGMITSGTRAQLLDRMRMHRRLDSVLMLATDGLYSTEPHDADIPIRLGGWERESYIEGMTIIRPGIYWLGGGTLRARGMGRATLERAQGMLAEGLAKGEERVVCPSRTAFGGARMTVYATPGGLRRSSYYGQWHEIPTHVSLAPGPKRARDWRPPQLSGVDSAPYGADKHVAILFNLLSDLRDSTL
jgi:hypothetical protein